MPDANGNFKGISIPELPWKVAAPTGRRCTGCGCFTCVKVGGSGRCVDDDQE